MQIDGENGKLFGAIGGKEIAAALQDQKGIAVDKKKISIAEPIKAPGEYQAKISLYENTFATIKVIVKS